MFTGIITHIGTVVAQEKRGDLRLSIESSLGQVRLGESIACNGACLTVVESDADRFSVDLSAETLLCTAPRWNIGDALNLERALKLGDALDGHMVTGHVDGVATLAEITRDGDSHVLIIDAPETLARFIAQKGSVTLDGVSLTVNWVDGARFSVNIIPHTWENTTLGKRAPGEPINIEIDMIARYVARLLKVTT